MYNYTYSYNYIAIEMLLQLEDWSKKMVPQCLEVAGQVAHERVYHLHVYSHGYNLSTHLCPPLDWSWASFSQQSPQ